MLVVERQIFEYIKEISFYPMRLNYTMYFFVLFLETI